MVNALTSPSGLPVPVGSSAALQLLQALARVPAERLSGTLTVTGHPGGVFHLRDGSVMAVESSGAPSVATILLATGRITEGEWAAGSGVLAPESLARASVGPATLHAMQVMVTLDGAFAVAAGRIDDVELVEGEPAAGWDPAHGVEPGVLLGEAERRLRALALSRVPICPFGDRPLLAGPVAACANRARREVLEKVNGRRSCRDIAFLLGRGLYVTTMEVVGLLVEGMVSLPEPPGEDPPRDDAAPGVLAAVLPRRSRGASGINHPEVARATFHPPFQARMRNPGKGHIEPNEAPE